MPHDSLSTLVTERAGRLWCLFLDRDGVINRRILDGYVQSWTEFVFEPRALEALEVLARWAPRIVVVTNQQGVGKGLMTSDDLAGIHRRMVDAIASASGRIDAVEACPHLAGEDCECRKPRPGMATRYLAAHPELDGSLSVMVGDTDSDMAMGRSLGVVTGGSVTVRIDRRNDPLADATFDSLAHFADAIAALLDEGGAAEATAWSSPDHPRSPASENG